MLYFGKSDVGMKRSVNQDSFSTRQISPDTLVAVVCDGMGGTAGGGIASSIAMDIYQTEISKILCEMISESVDSVEAAVEIPRAIRECARKANDFLFKVSKRDNSLAGMGTTLVSALIFKDRVFVANIGDSRLYKISKTGIEQITHDHSLVQYLVDQGRMSIDEARESKNKNIITRAVGVSDDVECDVFKMNVNPDADEYFLLCTDGLTNSIDDEEIKDIVLDRTLPDIKQKVEYLIDRANISGGADNITALIIKTEGRKKGGDRK